MEIIEFAPFSEHDPTDDPFCFGWRFRDHKLDDGTERSDQVPLTEWDLLHPLAGDFVVRHAWHTDTLDYLWQTIRSELSERTDVAVLHRMRIDWQKDGILPHGPDISVFSQLTRKLDQTSETFHVNDMGAKPLLLVEVTCPNSRRLDLLVKPTEYYRTGVPYYLVVDLKSDEHAAKLLAYQSGPEGFTPLEEEPDKGVWIPSVQLWFKSNRKRIDCYRADGSRILDSMELFSESEKLRTEIELLRQKLREAEERPK
jgi:colicin import membrane protein